MFLACESQPIQINIVDWQNAFLKLPSLFACSVYITQYSYNKQIQSSKEGRISFQWGLLYTFWSHPWDTLMGSTERLHNLFFPQQQLSHFIFFLCTFQSCWSLMHIGCMDLLNGTSCAVLSNNANLFCSNAISCDPWLSGLIFVIGYPLLNPWFVKQTFLWHKMPAVN